MRISLIVAMNEARVIGRDGTMPWHLPDDLRHFKTLTMDHPIVMGRKTFESLPKLLPRRHHIVLTRQRDLQIAGAEVVHDAEAAIAAAGQTDELFIIGGGEIYTLFLPRAHRIYLTLVEAPVEGDTHFPAYDAEAWDVLEIREHPADERHAWPFRFETLARRRRKG